MKKLITKRINKFYNMIGYIKNYDERSRWSKDYQGMQALYHCTSCNTDFEVNHHIYTVGCYQESVDNKSVHCPCCGNEGIYLYGSFVDAKRTIAYTDKDDEDSHNIPLNMELTVKELKEAILLEVKSKTYSNFKSTPERKIIRETYRFDIKHQTVTFQLRNARGQIEKEHILNSVFDKDIYKLSLLSHLTNDNNSNSTSVFDRETHKLVRNYQGRNDVREILAVLKHAVQKKWKTIHGYKLGSLYASNVEKGTRLIFPIINIAFRLRFPSEPNVKGQILNHGGNAPSWSNYNSNDYPFFKDFAKYSKNKDLIGNMFEDYSIKATPLLRKLVRGDYFKVRYYATIMAALKDQNYIKEFEMLINNKDNYDSYRYGYNSVTYQKYSVIESAERFAKIFGRSGKDIINFLKWCAKQPKQFHIFNDTADMGQRIDTQTIEESKKIKLKNLHDWLNERHKLIEIRLKHERKVQDDKNAKDNNESLNLSEKAIKRLSWEMHNIKFFMPTQSLDLYKGSCEFHNCVKGYTKRIQNKECEIVYMANDKGELVACLEVRNTLLVQAKLKYNKPVSDNRVVNQEIIEWCHKVGLTVATSDVKLPKDDTAHNKEKQLITAAERTAA